MSGNVSLHAVDDTNTLDNGKVKWIPVKTSSDGGLIVSPDHLAGEENETSKYNSQMRATEDWKWARVDLADNSTIVYSGNCRLGKIYVDTVMSAHACPILDGASSFASILASSAAGFVIDAFEGSRFTTSLIIDPDDAATGILLVQYREAKFSD